MGAGTRHVHGAAVFDGGKRERGRAEVASGREGFQGAFKRVEWLRGTPFLSSFLCLNSFAPQGPLQG